MLFVYFKKNHFIRNALNRKKNLKQLNCVQNRIHKRENNNRLSRGSFPRSLINESKSRN